MNDKVLGEAMEELHGYNPTKDEREYPRKMVGCDHDATPPADGAYNAPWEHCHCCGFVFFYIDSASYRFKDKGKTEVHGRSHIPNLCIACGGGYNEY